MYHGSRRRRQPRPENTWALKGLHAGGSASGGRPYGIQGLTEHIDHSPSLLLLVAATSLDSTPYISSSQLVANAF